MAAARNDRLLLAPLTSLRFFAAAAIVAAHLTYSYGYQVFTPYLGVGVSFFFVLSGFILAYRYPTFHAPGGIRKFYLSRIARIWPLHLATLLLVLVMWGPHDVIMFFLNFFLLQAWVPSYNWAFSFNGVSWSISCEAFFYLLFPAIIIFHRYIIGIFLVWCASIIAIVYFGVDSDLPAVTADHDSPWYVFVHVNPAVRFTEFLMGVIAGLLFLKLGPRRHSFAFWTGVELLASLGVAFAFLGVSLAYSVADMFGPGFVGWMYQLHHDAIGHLGPIATAWYGQSGSGPLLAAAILCFAYGGGLISRVLSLSPLVLLGEISFSTYMLHQVIQRFWMAVGWADGQWNLSSLITLLAVIYAASYLSWRYFERPMQAIVLRLGAVRRPTTSVQGDPLTRTIAD